MEDLIIRCKEEKCWELDNETELVQNDLFWVCDNLTEQEDFQENENIKKIPKHLNEPVHCDHGELKRKLVVKDGLIVLSTEIRDRLSTSPGPHKERHYYTCRMNNFPDDKMACKQTRDGYQYSLVFFQDAIESTYKLHWEKRTGRFMPSSSSYEHLRNRSIAIENQERTLALENGRITDSIDRKSEQKPKVGHKFTPDRKMHCLEKDYMKMSVKKEKMKKQVKTEKKIGRQSWRKRQEKKESTESGLGTGKDEKNDICFTDTESD